jgi:hypothetical protein
VSARFADMHRAGTFVLVNVHDPGSAATDPPPILDAELDHLFRR